ncbi:MAG TPA: hypothetical protein DCF68_04485 [Cyanothece sp. UBA12306]|nr:hypothetical protein [Cyanothece sp. UBA12306]
MSLLTFIDLFFGIGGLRIPFDNLGCQCVFSSEWDKYAQDMYEANFGERPYGDLTKIDTNDTENKFISQDRISKEVIKFHPQTFGHNFALQLNPRSQF